MHYVKAVQRQPRHYCFRFYPYSLLVCLRVFFGKQFIGGQQSLFAQERCPEQYVYAENRFGRVLPGSVGGFERVLAGDRVLVPDSARLFRSDIGTVPLCDPFCCVVGVDRRCRCLCDWNDFSMVNNTLRK